MNETVSSVIIIPSYNEILALPELLRELKLGLSHKDSVIVMDDSPKVISLEVESNCREAIRDSKFDFRFYNSELKSGRGAAVRRGMSIALAEFPNVTSILECDADGSHQPEDILKIKNSSSKADLIVGSRYLKSSKIVGWPVSRRIFSWTLNKIIPRLARVNLKDITNGLRRYSKVAVEEILSEVQVNSGFIYLSEQAIVVSRAKMVLSEEPITFVDRTLGSSTVTWREVLSSLLGISKLILVSLKE